MLQDDWYCSLINWNGYARLRVQSEETAKALVEQGNLRASDRIYMRSLAREMRVRDVPELHDAMYFADAIPSRAWRRLRLATSVLLDAAAVTI